MFNLASLTRGGGNERQQLKYRTDWRYPARVSANIFFMHFKPDRSKDSAPIILSGNVTLPEIRGSGKAASTGKPGKIPETVSYSWSDAYGKIGSKIWR